MRKYVLIACLLLVAGAHAQYNNEWIDYSKTYYKFKVGQTGLYRIGQDALNTLGLGNTPAEQYQLWRNGQEVPVYTSVASGTLPTGGYIEFWGEMNDGKPDRALYKNPAYQLTDTYSLETDTAAYFLTVNTTAANKRIINAVNDVANNTLAPEPYFLHTYRKDYKEMINEGKGVYFGQVVHSSTYDMGEFWTTNSIYGNDAVTTTASNLFVAASGPAAVLATAVAGDSYTGNDRRIKVSINGTNYIDQPLTLYNAQVLSNSNVPLSAISSNTATIKVSKTSADAGDHFAVGYIYLTYPRVFNFGGAKNFTFKLPASAQGNYLEITNFGSGAATPVLYDIANGKRYAANTSTPNILKFALAPGNTDRTLILVNEEAANITPVTAFAKRNFINYAVGDNQGDYLIISNKILFAGDNGVEQYRAYRSGVAGGSYNAKLYDIDELVDQFAFGIKKHPLSVKNFLQLARDKYAVKPKFVFIIGKAVTYNQYRYNESSEYADRLNLVPTFGWPASDNILASNDLNPVAAIPIGRLSAISNEEVKIYLSKIKEYEQVQKDNTQTIDNKAWMKNVVHVVGASNDFEDVYLGNYLKTYENILKDTLYGAHVYTFSKTTTGAATPVTNALMAQLFAQGISIINYFGHSSSITLNYNLNDPEAYNNPGKYPSFLVSGCDAGDFYGYSTSRINVISSIAEKYVLAKERGSICLVGSTHFGVGDYLNYYNLGFINTLNSAAGYNKNISVSMAGGIRNLLSSFTDSTSKYLHAEQTVLHGDPALKIYAFDKPDFVIEDPQVVIDPTFVSVASNSFNVKTYFYNIGKATGDSVSVSIKRQFPDGSTTTLLSKNIKSVRYKDSLSIDVPIIASRDKGQNKLIVAIDDKNKYDELSEANNTVTKTFFIYEDELTPVYPYKYAIVNKTNIRLAASTADPAAPARQYAMEIDTTALFNSSLKATKTVASLGGVIEFDPGVSFRDSTVYYWRVAPVPADASAYRWNTSSFVYIANSSFGYNQSHVYQHLQSATDRIYLDSSSRTWYYKDRNSSMEVIHSVFGISGFEDIDQSIRINGDLITSSACLGHSVIYTIFDPVTLKPYYNQAVPSVAGSGRYGNFMGSAASCNHEGVAHNFEFSYQDTANRRKMRDFMDWIPDGAIVTARFWMDPPFEQNAFAPTWKADALYYGAGNTWYDRLVSAGFTKVDSFSYPRIAVFIYQKNNTSFEASQVFSAGLEDRIDYMRNIVSPDSLGYVTSPQFGPAKAWKAIKWRGKSVDAKAGDNPVVQVIGIAGNGTRQVLYNLNSSQQDFDISSVSATTYPYLQLQLRNADSLFYTPYQLRYWRILYDPVPEGGLSANIAYSYKDTLDPGETLKGKIAFKNVSDVAFNDSIKVNLVIYNKSNAATTLPVDPGMLKKLAPGDTAVLHFNIDSKTYPGLNTIYLDVNPNNDQPEQTHINNFMYKSLYVKEDIYNPVLDVTFDGVHILNNDLISAKPFITIKMKDESNYLLLNDTSLVNVQLIYPDNSVRRFTFNSDTLHFTPATNGGADNVATVDFTPYLTEDGQYKLVVSGKDKAGNPAGNTQYSVAFMVVNKPMISNMFNYPNPFTTSTAFVFTVTGSEVPQNLRIQILTITGKVVKEITKEELGSLHIGRNITDYKWDGTDQYGQKLREWRLSLSRHHQPQW